MLNLKEEYMTYREKYSLRRPSMARSKEVELLWVMDLLDSSNIDCSQRERIKISLEARLADVRGELIF